MQYALPAVFKLFGFVVRCKLVRESVEGKVHACYTTLIHIYRQAFSWPWKDIKWLIETTKPFSFASDMKFASFSEKPLPSILCMRPKLLLHGWSKQRKKKVHMYMTLRYTPKPRWNVKKSLQNWGEQAENKTCFAPQQPDLNCKLLFCFFFFLFFSWCLRNRFYLFLLSSWVFFLPFLLLCVLSSTLYRQLSQIQWFCFEFQGSTSASL